MSALTENPFASTNSLDTNPFDDPTPTQPSFGQSGAAPQRTAGRLDDIERRERDLEAREQALNSKQENLRKHGRNNWPFFFPLIFHSVKDEIPEASQTVVTRLYQLWLVLFATLIINMVACIFILTSGEGDGAHDLGASLGYIPFITILSFLLWYRPVYNAYMKEQALYYYLFFFFCGWHLVFSAYMIIGIPSTGSAGLINMITMYNHDALVAGILGTVATVGWTLQGVGLAWYYLETWKHHNSQGHTFNKARGELAQHGAKAYFTRE
ncbi:scamp-domain-containing protein [Auriculariales sp. MPI-PUGE-AT-0066]|nr:scamp-domain-containing protein [Auriculariales sp. MPI-PUGE-AT-0066]